jgi:hypothetical protein
MYGGTPALEQTEAGRVRSERAEEARSAARTPRLPDPDSLGSSASSRSGLRGGRGGRRARRGAETAPSQVAEPPPAVELLGRYRVDEYEQRPVRDVGEVPGAPLISGRCVRMIDEQRAPRGCWRDARLPSVSEAGRVPGPSRRTEHDRASGRLELTARRPGLKRPLAGQTTGALSRSPIRPSERAATGALSGRRVPSCHLPVPTCSHPSRNSEIRWLGRFGSRRPFREARPRGFEPLTFGSVDRQRARLIWR